MENQPFEYECPICKKKIVAWTQRALRDITEDHEYRHRRETGEFHNAVTEPGTSIIVYEERNYDILPLTAADIGFLKTRHIKVDEQDKPDA